MQRTHNSLSLGSNPSGPTNYVPTGTPVKIHMELKKYIDGLYNVDVRSHTNVKVLKNTCHMMNDIITKSFKHDEQDFDRYSSATTKLYRKYNFLLYPLPGIHSLYFTIASAFHACFRDSSGNESTEGKDFFIQSWMNFYKKNEFIVWHTHSDIDVGAWHGFVCVETEPDSFTSYRWPNDQNRKDVVVNIPSKDGFIVMGKSNGDYHCSSQWLHDDRPRITIAFDIIPRSHIFTDNYSSEVYLNLVKNNQSYINHWIPI